MSLNSGRLSSINGHPDIDCSILSKIKVTFLFLFTAFLIVLSYFKMDQRTLLYFILYTLFTSRKT